MKRLNNNLSARLEKHQIRPSIQRFKILEFLINNQCHPTADQVYRGLKNDIPTLSVTTVYNTLNLFVEKGLLKELTIQDNKVRYDIITAVHGHFQCLECGKINNFDLSLDEAAVESLKGYRVVDRNVYFKGICSECLLSINKVEREE